MSRGLGIIERRALTVLHDREQAAVNSASALDIAGQAEGLTAVPESTYRSYARALRSLVAKGLAADMGRGFRFGRRRYALPQVAEQDAARQVAVFGSSRPLARPLKSEGGK